MHKSAFILILSLAAFIAPACITAQKSQPKHVRLAICQILVIDSDREGNFRRIEYALEQAAAQHAQIAVFPESSILGWENPDAHKMATPIPGTDDDAYRDITLRGRRPLILDLGANNGASARWFAREYSHAV